MNSIIEIRKTLDVLKPSGLIEIRSVGGKAPISGYFEDRGNLLKQVERFPEDTWYFVMNKIDGACFSREQHEKLSMKAKAMTSDADITRLEWILVDVDPIRLKGISSTDDEKAHSLQVIRAIYKYLRQTGFAEPVAADSGNGYHLLYNVDLPCECSSAVQTLLKALDMLFSDDKSQVDISVFNPSRITKLYGTVARKGADTADRPHRQSAIIRVPEKIEKTSIALIEKVAGELVQPEEPTYRNDYGGHYQQFDVREFMQRHGMAVSKESTWNGGSKYVLEHCPFDGAHTAPDSAVFVGTNGAIGFKCFHNSCAGKGWKEVRELYEPRAERENYYRPRTSAPSQAPSANVPIPGDTFLRLGDIAPLDRSKIITMKSGIAGIDGKMLGFNKGDVTVWSGGNGSGKSTLLSQLALECVQNGFKCAMFSGEMSGARMQYWMLLQAAGRKYVSTADGLTYFVKEDVAKAIKQWTGDRLWLYNNQYGFDARKILNDFDRHMTAHATDVIIIDNLMALDTSGISDGRTMDKYERQTNFMLQLVALARKRDIHIHFVCHPRKPTGFLRKSDISGTADLTNAADNVIMVHRVNEDFKRCASEFFGVNKAREYEAYTNVIEIMKNRDLGIQDVLVGLEYEGMSKRLLNEKQENRMYDWIENYADDSEF